MGRAARKHTSVAGEIIRHLGGDVEVLDHGLGDTVDAGDVVDHGELLHHQTRVAALVNVAFVGAGAVRVDLVHHDGDFAAALHLRHGPRGEGVLGVQGNVDIADQLVAAAEVDQVCVDLGVADQVRVQLARADQRAVAGLGGVNWCIRGQYITN